MCALCDASEEGLRSFVMLEICNKGIMRKMRRGEGGKLEIDRERERERERDKKSIEKEGRQTESNEREREREREREIKRVYR